MNSFNAYPEQFSGSEIDNFEKYRCPISGVSAKGENAPRWWVNCPLVENPICLGACLDLQAIARDRDFETHPFVDDFYKLSRERNIEVLELRKICLTHQKEVLQNMLHDPLENTLLVQELLDWVSNLYTTLTR